MYYIYSKIKKHILKNPFIHVPTAWRELLLTFWYLFTY